MNKNFAKLLIVIGIVAGLLTLAKALYWAPNDTADSGLSTTEHIDNSYASSTSIGLPDHLLIPKLNINADIQRLGITKKGNMAAPNNFTDVSWYKLGTIPGQDGSAVIAGHEDNAISLDGVFKHLEDLEINDRIYVVDEAGQKLEFKVVEKQIYPYNLSGPELERVFNEKGKPRLNLITCAGHWLPSAHTNDKRLVVYTELVK